MPPFNICPENPQKNLVTYISKERVSDSVRAIFTFTFRIVEAIKQTKIQAPPSKMTLPFSVSVAAGLIVLMLSFTVPYSPLYPILGEFGCRQQAKGLTTNCRKSLFLWCTQKDSNPQPPPVLSIARVSSVSRMCGGDMPGSNTLGSLSTCASGWSFVSAGFAE